MSVKVGCTMMVKKPTWSKVFEHHSLSDSEMFEPGFFGWGESFLVPNLLVLTHKSKRSSSQGTCELAKRTVSRSQSGEMGKPKRFS